MKIIYFLLTLVVLLFSTPNVAFAHCPLCTAGAGMGLILSRWLGIDDSITGIWLAALLGASSLWFSNSIKKRLFPFQEALIYWVVLLSTIWSFSFFKLVVPAGGTIMGVPKLIFGMISGGVVFYLTDIINKLIKRVKGRSLFPYQSISFSLGSMLILSLADFVFITYFI